MSAIANFTWRSLGANRVRTAVTIAGVALAAALLTAVLGTFTSLNHFMYQSEEQLTGTWMARATLEDANATAQLEAAQSASDVTSVATVQEVGFAALSDKQQEYLGPYATVLSFSGDLQTMGSVSPCEGEMPDQPGEILLFETWKSKEGVAIGDTITLNVGQRELIMPEGEEDLTVTEQSMDLPHAYEVTSEGEVTTTTYEPGMILHGEDAYNSSVKGGIYDERLINTQEHTYTVVGFYDRSTFAISSAVGQSCLIAGEIDPSEPLQVYLSFSGMNNQTEVKEATLNLFPDAGVTLHTALLRFMGISGDGAIWDTFFGLVSILAIIIVVACVSLIYNAFAISLAQRAGQFGLLSSIGASKRQLRRAVLFEAGFVTLVGVPLGLLIGIGGCVVTFAVLGPDIARIAVGEAAQFEAHFEAWALIFAAVLTVLTVFASAFLPALRISRVSAIDAIREAQTGRISKRGLKDARVSARPGKVWKNRGLAGRVFGMSGQLAHINQRRSSSKSRAASISLALAVVLIMTAGSLNMWLGSLVDAARGSELSDFAVSASFEDRRADAQLMEQYAQAYESLASVTGAEGVGWTAKMPVPALVPDQMVGASLVDGSLFGVAGTFDTGVVGCMAQIVFLDDASFASYADSMGINATQFDNVTAQSAPALALAQGYGNNGMVYQLLTMLKDTGTIQLVVGAQEDGVTASYISFMSTAEREYLAKQVNSNRASASSAEDANGAQSADPRDTDASELGDQNAGDDVVLAPYYFDEADDIVYLDPEKTTYDYVDIEVVALVEEAPEILGDSSGVVLIMPASTAAILDLHEGNPSFHGAFNLSPDTDLTYEEVAEELEEQRESAFAPLANQTSPDYYTISNMASEMENITMMATVVNVFCLLFAIILALIALANVFNTITNGLILRRREFAIMKSVGLSGRQFRRMIVSECVGYSLRGLIPGVVLSLLVSALLYAAVTLSLSGITFSIPWLYVLLAIGMVSVAMALSVAYGMNRCKADNIVEALRREAQ